MINKNYPFPLFSLNIAPPATAPEGHYFVPTEAGDLVVPKSLRDRGRGYNSALCKAGVETALAALARYSGVFADYGLTPEWGDNMRHWVAELDRFEAGRVALREERRASAAKVRQQALRGRELWHAVVVFARLAGYVGFTQRKTLPQESYQAAEVLQGLLARMRTPEVQSNLYLTGLSAKVVNELDGIVAEIMTTKGAHDVLVQRHAALGGAILVVRSALVGDLSRFAQIAAIALPRSHAAPLQLQHLLPNWRRESSSAKTWARITEERKASAKALHDQRRRALEHAESEGRL